MTDADGRLVGVVTLEEVHLASLSPHLGPLVVAADRLRGDVEPLTPEDRLERAMELFVENDLLVLPVVDGPAQRRVVGLVKRADISGTYLRQLQGVPGAREGSSPIL